MAHCTAFQIMLTQGFALINVTESRIGLCTFVSEEIKYAVVGPLLPREADFVLLLSGFANANSSPLQTSEFPFWAFPSNSPRHQVSLFFKGAEPLAGG